MLDRALLAPALAHFSPAEQQLLAAAYDDDQDDHSLGRQLHLRAETAKARRRAQLLEELRARQAREADELE